LIDFELKVADNGDRMERQRVQKGSQEYIYTLPPPYESISPVL
jgi:hypothetical protein